MILNPFLHLRLLTDADGNQMFELGAPRRESGMKTLFLPRREFPELFDLFLELSQTSLTLLDIENDLTERDCKLLAAHNVLLDKTEVPTPPMFACWLDEIAVAENFADNGGSLIVNEFFRFEDAKDFQTLASRRLSGMLANHPVAWVTDAGTEITLGYWLRGELLEIVKCFTAKEPPPISLSAAQIAVLRQARILVDADYTKRRRAEWNAKFAEAADFFRREHYVLLESILPAEQCAAVGEYFRRLQNAGFMLLDDGQVERRYGVYRDPLTVYLHRQLAFAISRATGEKVIPSYVYAANYIEDAVLKPHTDRPQCEFTMSMQIAYAPALKPREKSPWALCLDDLRENRVESYLACGDGLIYKGCELVHYRDALPKNHQSTSIFFHYVNENFTGGLD
jgi:hypothetical protein